MCKCHTHACLSPVSPIGKRNRWGSHPWGPRCPPDHETPMAVPVPASARGKSPGDGEQGPLARRAAAGLGRPPWQAGQGRLCQARVVAVPVGWSSSGPPPQPCPGGMHPFWGAPCSHRATGDPTAGDADGVHGGGGPGRPWLPAEMLSCPGRPGPGLRGRPWGLRNTAGARGAAQGQSLGLPSPDSPPGVCGQTRGPQTPVLCPRCQRPHGRCLNTHVRSQELSRAGRGPTGLARWCRHRLEAPCVSAERMAPTLPGHGPCGRARALCPERLPQVCLTVVIPLFNGNL